MLIFTLPKLLTTAYQREVKNIYIYFFSKLEGYHSCKWSWSYSQTIPILKRIFFFNYQNLQICFNHYESNFIIFVRKYQSFEKNTQGRMQRWQWVVYADNSDGCVDWWRVVLSPSSSSEQSWNQRCYHTDPDLTLMQSVRCRACVCATSARLQTNKQAHTNTRTTHTHTHAYTHSHNLTHTHTYAHSELYVRFKV